MGNVDWNVVGTFLTGVGTFLLGLAAMVTIFIQWGYRKQAEKLKETIKERDAALIEAENLRDKNEETAGLLMAFVLRHTNQFLRSEDGVVFSYPEDKEIIYELISKRIHLHKSIVAEMLDNLEEEGFFEG